MGDNKKKTLLIIDDSEIDREILKNILLAEFNVIDVASGNQALELFKNHSEIKISGILLDIYMPVMDGFQVLANFVRFGIHGIPIIMISADALKENILKAARFGVTAFIKKPFDQKVVLAKVNQVFFSKEKKEEEHFTKDELDTNVSEKSLNDIDAYVERLNLIYTSYLKDNEKDNTLYKKVRELMHFMLEQYSLDNPEKKLSSDLISVVCDAAYLYDIGKMIVSNNEKEISGLAETAKAPFYSHTLAGAAFVRLNTSPSVSFFTKVCGDICAEHHERYDGKGFPRALFGDSISIFAQMCSLAIQFATEFLANGFDAAYNAIEANKDAYSADLFYLLKCLRPRLSAFYNS